MKNILFTLLLFSSIIQAQHVLSSRLQDSISHAEHIDQKFAIRIEMQDKVDAFQLHKEYIRTQTPIKERAIKTIKRLKNKAKTSQKNLIDFLKYNAPSSYNTLRKYWITNQIYLEGTQDIIYEIGQRNDVAYIDLNIDKTSPLEEISSEHQLVSTGTIETGLEAINAPALWNLGYTGRGLLVYDYDTGVCPEHPAIKNRFLANHFPMDQSWYGYFKDFPNESNSDHGTHTLGTMIGKGLPSGDTIGVAPRAYWMACDLVTSTVEELPPLENIVAAYEWALDADNDSETTDDIPDVINNSWRWNDNPDTVHCNDYIRDLMNVIEAVGIANIFSGGNAGPNNTTISAPQRINTTIVNTFSVGSVNANLNGNPISYFSSRGPLQCPANDSALIIHPEVVAPGHDVRSSVGPQSYSTKSGTSMAAPHVSGAVLLLKEAFPQLSGAEILTALYYTASDLGDTGEDNTFGRGIINCFSAYEYLSQSYTPTNPNLPKNDLIFTKIHEPSPIIFCNNTVNPNFSITNNGTETIDSIIFSLILNDELLETSTWYGNLDVGDTLNHSLTSFIISELDSIENELQIKAIVPHWDEIDIYNNSMMQRFSIHRQIEAPFIETFESNSFSTMHWKIINNDDEASWELSETNGLDNSNISAKAALFNYENIYQKDILLTPNIHLTNNSSYYLNFDYAHQHRNVGGRKDSLIIEVSSDCGSTYKRVFAKGGSSLSTTDTLDMNFEPIYSTHWEHKSIQLSEYINNEEFIQLKFTTVNGKQNNLFLDNISVATQEEFSALALQTEDILLMPNPANNNIKIIWDGNKKQDIHVDLIDISGRIVDFKEYSSIKSLTINWILSELETGYYFFRFKTEDGIFTKSFVKN